LESIISDQDKSNTMDACKLLQNMRWEEAFLLPYEQNRVTRLQSLVIDKYTPPSSKKMPAGLACSTQESTAEIVTPSRALHKIAAEKSAVASIKLQI
jgi:hypothetical protein